MTTTQPAPGGRTAVGAVAWAGLTQVLGKGATVVATLVLARLLVPADFGLFAVGLLVINYLDRVKDVGIGAALVYRREDWTRMAGTGLPLSVLSSGVLAGLAYLSAPLAASFFHDPRAADLVRVLAVALFVSGLAVVPESGLRRAMDFRRRLVPETAAALVKGGVSIWLAASGHGVWSLVWGQVAGTMVQSLLYWALCGWRPTLSWHREDARVLLRYGIPSACVAVLAVIHDNLDYLVIGRRMSGQDLGFYTMAYRMPELVVIGICLVVGQVLFPVLSRLQEDPEALRRRYVEVVRLVSLATVPAGLLLAILADEVVLVLYSATWEPAVPVLRLLALFSVVYGLSFHAGEVYKATGRPGILNALAVLKIAVLAPALWVAAGHSITAVALAVLLVNVVLTVVKLKVVARILSLPMTQLVGAFRATAVASTAMALAVTAAGTAVTGLSPLWRLVLLSLVAAVSLAAAIHVVAPDVSHRVLDRARGMRFVPKAGR